MRPVALYIDDHRDYQWRLSRRLRSLSDETYDVLAIDVKYNRDVRVAVVESLTREIRNRVTAILCPQHLAVRTLPDHLPALAVHINLCERMSEDEVETCAQRSRKRQSETERRGTYDIRHISRFAQASQIDATIRRHLPVRELSDNSSGHRNSIGTHLSFSHETGTRVTRYVIGREQALGHTVIYLPIKPLYKIEYSFRRSHGLTCGDLIYRFTVGDIPDTEDMGRWLYMHEDGYYTCSMPERSDDLITCDIDTLRRITHAWRAYTHARSHPTTTWIDIEGMPLGDVLSLAILCDFIYIDAPTGKSDKEAVARRELGLFMAKLPGECRILELPHRREPLREVEHISLSQESDIAAEL